MNYELDNIQLASNMTPEQIQNEWAKLSPSEWGEALALNESWSDLDVGEVIADVKVLAGDRILDSEFEADCAWSIKNIYEDGLESERQWKSLFSKEDPDGLTLRAYSAFRAYISYRIANEELKSRTRFYK